MNETVKPFKEGAYDKKAIEVETIQRKTVIPYEDVKKALEHGKIYVLPKGISRNTVAQAKKRLMEKYGLEKVKVGKTKVTKQFVFYI